VRFARDRKGFVLDTSGRSFVPWGFHDVHDDKERPAFPSTRRIEVRLGSAP
jgi:hypothetical protein